MIERDPKTENSFRILRVPKAVMKEVERRLQKIQLEKERAGDTYEDNGYVEKMTSDLKDDVENL